MNPNRANIINSISLILMGIWGFFDLSSPTALIPSMFGLLLLGCFLFSYKKQNLNKIFAHIAIVLTLIILLSLVAMRLPKSIDDGGIGLIRVLIMISTSLFSIVIFVKSFVDMRKN